MPISRTTVSIEQFLIERADNHARKDRDETLNEFLTRAIINQLEQDGDFDIRDIMEEIEDASK